MMMTYTQLYSKLTETWWKQEQNQACQAALDEVARRWHQQHRTKLSPSLLLDWCGQMAEKEVKHD